MAASPSSSRSPAASRRGGRAARQSPFFRDLASPIPSHRGGSRFASAAAAAPSPATLPPPPLFTLDDRFAAADFSPDPTASDLLPVASSPSPRAGSGSRSPSWDRSRGKASAHGSPMDGVVEPPRKELLALPPPSSPCTPPPTATAAAAEAPSPVTPATETARTEPATEGKVDGEEWVTVFGFSLRDTNLVLREFEKCGVILRHHSGPREGNWIHILYQHSYDARKALQKNGIQLCSGVIIGVKHIDPMHQQQLDDRFTGINQGGFMVSLPSKSLVLKSSTGASNQLGALPRPYDPKSSTNVIREGGRRTTGSVAAPAKSIVTNVMDLIFGI
ncbi:nuclear pore complex protein NUP35 isoform X1 [Hordeum vulgare subsp. vulgare]|uniref:Nuclear pore complex protein NUP35 n=1 Tax=Hordeum vulgare subsp. vulgare TaxID=112509 RepID=A0A287GAK5_HORVV|nr:nuclear pore complex protein NUP35 isoform X1 [Hordeum vulgare subsp. vulgare]